MGETEPAQTDIERIWNISLSISRQYNNTLHELARAIAKDFHAALVEAGIPVYERIGNEPVRHLNTHTYLVALSQLLSVVDLSTDVSFACMLDAPEPDVTAQVPDGGR